MQDVHGNSQCRKTKKVRLIQLLQLQFGLCDMSLPNIPNARLCFTNLVPGCIPGEALSAVLSRFVDVHLNVTVERARLEGCTRRLTPCKRCRCGEDREDTASTTS